MTNSPEIIDIDNTGAAADGSMHVTAMGFGQIASTMFDLKPVIVRNPAGEVSDAFRVALSDLGLDVLRHEISREVRKIIKQERDRSLREHHS